MMAMASKNCLMRLNTLQLHFEKCIASCRGLHTSPRVFQMTQYLEAVSQAQNLLGNPTFLSLENVTSHEISNMAVYLTNLIATGHPLSATVTELLVSEERSDLSRGMLVSLVSKAGKSDPNEDILPNQRKLAEITEQIHTAGVVHAGIINLPTPDENLETGNKLAILCGDFIQSRSSIRLAELQNIKILDLFGQAIADLSAAEFMDNGKCDALDLWTQKTKMRYGTLLSSAFQSTLIVGGNMGLLESAKRLGFEIAFAWQANIDLQSYKNTATREEHNLTKLFSPGTPFEKIVSDFEAVRDKYINASLITLETFPKNDATRALRKIVKALKN